MAMRDDFGSYVVVLVGSVDPDPFSHFLARSDADRSARERIKMRENRFGYVFGVATTATGDAFTRVLRGNAELVETVVRGTLQAQSESDFTEAWEQARQAGSVAIRQFLGR